MSVKKLKKDQYNKPVTLGVLLEYTDEFFIPRFAELMDEKIGESEKRMDKKMDEKMGASEKRLNANLDRKLAEHTYELKDYIDKKLANHTAEIFQRLDRKYAQENNFRSKVLELFKKHRIGTSEDMAFLQGLVNGS